MKEKVRFHHRPYSENMTAAFVLYIAVVVHLQLSFYKSELFGLQLFHCLILVLFRT